MGFGVSQSGGRIEDPRFVTGRGMLDEIIYDSDGNLVTGSLLDYLLPTATDVPRFDLELAETPCTTNSLGVKGVGESGSIGAPPTVINAILDALRPLGVTDLSMPAGPMRVWQAIENARSGRHDG